MLSLDELWRQASSSLPSPTLAVASIIALFVLRATYNAFTGPLFSLPGPEISRWTDLPLRLTAFTGRRAQYVHSLHQKYGPVVRIGPQDVAINDGVAAREIHQKTNSKKGDGFPKSEFYGPAGNRFQSMFSTRDPDFHTRRRRMLGPCFTEASLLSTLEPRLLDLVHLAVRRIRGESLRDGSADVLKWWTLMAMDVIGELSFGESFGMLQSGRKNQFAEDVASAGAILPLRTAFPALIWMGSYLPFVPFFNNIAQSRQRIMAYQQERVARYLQLVGAGSEDRNMTLFAALVKGNDKNKSGEAEKLTPVELMVEAQSYITAGTDTTAVTLTYLIWAVCRDEKIQETLVRELQEAIPDPGQIPYATIRDLQYLNCVIEEAFRCYGAAPGALPRDVPAQGVSLAGRHIPGGVVVSTQAYSVHRNPSAFPEPERFDPSRWESPTKEMKDAFTAFGTGPRGCIGVHLARMELRLAAALFFRTFPNARISKEQSDADMDPSISFLLMPKGHRCLIEAE